jgi:hypothetical protein
MHSLMRRTSLSRGFEAFGVLRRGLASETKEAFRPPPGPPQGNDNTKRVLIIGTLSLGLLGIAMLPQNYYSTDEITIPTEKNRYTPPSR